MQLRIENFRGARSRPTRTRRPIGRRSVIFFFFFALMTTPETSVVVFAHRSLGDLVFFHDIAGRGAGHTRLFGDLADRSTPFPPSDERMDCRQDQVTGGPGSTATG